MSPSNAPDPRFPPPFAPQRVVRRLRADVEATQAARGLVRASPVTGDLRYLDRLVHKPWGSEFRVYEDDVIDVWCLHIRPRQRTSLHCHPHKVTALLCMDGGGTLSTRVGTTYSLVPGVVLHVEPGAYHRIAAGPKTGLRLVEVERPKDKFDLLRIEDDYRDPTEPYEGERHAPLRLVEQDHAGAVPLALQPFVEQPLAGTRRGRVRAPTSSGRYRFGVQPGEQVRASNHFLFALALEAHATTSRAVAVLDSERAHAAAPDTVYLTIRTN